MNAALLLATLLVAAPEPKRTLEGVPVPSTIQVDAGAVLHLNGAGVRRATLFNVKVYVGALYLTTPSSDGEAVVQADEAKSVRMRFLRDVDRGKVMDAFREGFEKNSAADAKRLAPGLAQVATVVPEELREGSVLSITYLPGTGTAVVGPSGQVVIPGKDFADAMFRIWLGREPADRDLKRAMLGGRP